MMKKKYLLVLIAAALLVLALLWRCENSGTGGSIYGLYEKVFLPEISAATVKAKLDTGASTTSLGAENIQIFQKEGQDWVRFTPQIKGAATLERPLARHSEIRLRNAENSGSRLDRRPVVMLKICFDGHTYETEVNLTDRSRFDYVLLIGSDSLVQFGAAVDPARQYISNPGCDK